MLNVRDHSNNHSNNHTNNHNSNNNNNHSYYTLLYLEIECNLLLMKQMMHRFIQCYCTLYSLNFQNICKIIIMKEIIIFNNNESNHDFRINLFSNELIIYA
jgi:hypothetical protein